MNPARSSPDDWREMFQQQRASGLSVAAFCRRLRVPASSFFAWRRKLRESLNFAEVRVAPEGVAVAPGIELRLPRQRCIVVRPGFDRRTLLELLHALEAEGAGARETAG